MSIAERLAVVLANDRDHVLLMSALEEYAQLLFGYAEDADCAGEREQWIQETSRIDRMIAILDAKD